MMNVTLRQDQLAAKSREFKERVGRTMNEVLERAAGAALDLYNTLVLLSQRPFDVSVSLVYAIAGAEEIPSGETIKNALAIGLNATLAYSAMKLGIASEQEAAAAMAQQLQNLGIVPPAEAPTITPAPLMPGEWGGFWLPSGGGTGFPATRDMQERARLMQRIRQDVLRAQLYNFRYYETALGRVEGFLPFPSAQSWRLPTPEEQELFAEQLRRFRTRPGIMEAAQEWLSAYRQQRLAEQLRAFRGTDIASLGAIGGVLPAKIMGVEGISGIAERLQDALRPTAEMQKALQQMADAAERAGKSLREIWGIAPTAFDASLYDEAAKALREYDVSAEKSNEAMRYMALTTGEANAQSEIFGLRARAAAEALEKGELSAAGFAVQMGLLAREDWSWVDRLMKVPSTETGLRHYMEVIERLASGEVQRAVGELPDQIAELQRQFSGESAAPEVDPFQVMIDRIQEVEGQSKTSFSEMEGHMTAWVDLSTLTIRGWREDFIKEIKQVETKMGEFTGRPWKVTITTSFGETGEGGGLSLSGPTIRGGFQAFQRGGYTGDGPPNQIAGVVHRGEFVISQDMLRQMRQGIAVPRLPVIMPGQGGGVTITGPIHVHGVENPAQLLEALEREAGRRNLRLMAARS
jgi:hypothetical protein